MNKMIKSTFPLYCPKYNGTCGERGVCYCRTQIPRTGEALNHNNCLLIGLDQTQDKIKLFGSEVKCQDQ